MSSAEFVQFYTRARDRSLGVVTALGLRPDEAEEAVRGRGLLNADGTSAAQIEDAVLTAYDKAGRKGCEAVLRLMQPDHALGRTQGMTSVLRISAMTFATVFLLASALVNPAHAETRTVHDRSGDGSHGTGTGGPRKFGDIGKVQIRYSPTALSVTVLPAAQGQLADFYDLYLDTDSTRPGPELVVTTGAETERYGVSRTRGYRASGNPLCQGNATWDFGRRQSVAVTVPRRCLVIDAVRAGRLRVSVHSEMEYGGADWAPGRGAFGPWLMPGR